jgi:hypothetical protein
MQTHITGLWTSCDLTMLICSRLYDFVHFPLQVVVRDKLSPMDRSLVSFLAYKAFDKDTFPDKPAENSRAPSPAAVAAPIPSRKQVARIAERISPRIEIARVGLITPF